jgi:MoaA/NifB/PqqE/SkfB family radical SAM enzyme
MKNVRENTANIKKQWVRLTRVCNNQCLFCLDKDAQNNTVIPFAKIKKELQLGRRNGAVRAVLSGGEPTLHPRLIDIITTAKRSGYSHIQIITNGRMFAYKNFLTNCLASGLSEVTFSVHGHTEKLHDRLTGVPGSYRQTMQALKYALNEKNLIVSVDIVINGLNVQYVKAIIDHLADIGVREFDLLHVIPFGRAWENRKTIFYDIEKALPRLRDAFQLSLDPDFHVWANRFPPSALEDFEHLMQHPFKIYEEIKSRRKIFDQFLNNGKKMYCRGKRCQFCFLESFCSSFIELKKEKMLAINNTSFCSKIKSTKQKYILNCKKTDLLEDFFNFFINNGFFIKSRGCRLCSLSAQCDGILYENVRDQGFKIFRPMTKKEEISFYLNKFTLSQKMKKIVPVILNNPELSSLHTGFKLDTKNLKNRCVIEILEKIGLPQKQVLFKDILTIGKFILSADGFASLKKLRFLIRDIDLRIGYSVRDGKPIALKVYILFDEGLNVNITGLKKAMRQLGFNINPTCFNQNKSILSLEFCENLTSVSFYKAFDNLPVNVPRLNTCKNAYYFIAHKKSKNGCFTPKKLYKVYDRENKDPMMSEIKDFLGNTPLLKIVIEDFTGCEIDAVGLRLDDRAKDIYIKVD